MIKTGKLFFAFLISALSLCAAMKVSIGAAKMGLNDTVAVQVIIEGQQLQPKLLSDDFVLAGQSSGNSISIVNGNASYSWNFTYNLKPKRTGSLQFFVEAGAEKQGPFAVEVVEGSLAAPAPARGRSLLDEFFGGGAQNAPISENDVIIRNELSKSECWPGETVLLRKVLYSRIQLSGLGVRKSDGADNLRFEAVEKFDPKPAEVRINNEPYTRRIIQVMRVTPLIAGRHNIRGGVLTAARSGGFFSEGAQADFKAPDLSLTAKSFPVKGKPANFKGAAGNFTLTAEADKKTAAVGDVVTVKITVEGRGNLRNMAVPDLKIKEGEAALSAGAAREQLTQTDSGEKGRKSVEYNLLTRSGSDIVFAPVELCYFDTAASVYKTLIVKLQPISVSGQISSAAAKAAPVIRSSYELEWIDETMSIVNQKLFSSWEFILGHFAAALVFGSTFYIRRRMGIKTANPSAFRVSQAAVKFRKAVKKAAQQKGDDALKILDLAVRDYLCDRLNQPRGTALSVISRRLDSIDKGASAVSAVIDLSKKIQQLRYDPAQKKTPQALISRSLETVNRCEESFS